MLALRRTDGLYRPLCGVLRAYSVKQRLNETQQTPAVGFGAGGVSTIAHRTTAKPLYWRYPAVMSSYPRHYANEPAPPNLPDRQQVEKCFFRCVAFVWDVGAWLIAWTIRNFQVYVIGNPTVQDYYKKLLHKMEQSKKD